MTEMGVFDATTRPTSDQVTGLIGEAVDAVDSRTGTICANQDDLEQRATAHPPHPLPNGLLPGGSGLIR